jgi:flagellar hook protein FlgE
MSIISNLYQGVSGLNSNADQMEVVGNNIANVNTIGYKAGRANFEEILGRSIIGSFRTSHIGQGSKLSNVDTNFSQGSFLSTGNATDLAVAGDGFFIVRGLEQGSVGSFYTRAGQFRLDTEGFLTTGGGHRLQGFQIVGDNTVGDKLGDVQIPVVPAPPRATSTVEAHVSLRSGEDGVVPAWDVTDPVNTSHYSTTATVYDSLGTAREVDIYFRKTADNEWEYHAVVRTDETELGGVDDFTEIGAGTLTFNSDGNLQTETGGALAVQFEDGAAAQTMTLDFGLSLDEGGDGSSGSKQVENREYDLLFLEQDGRATGSLQSVRVEEDGTIIGSYSNREELALGRVALARFLSVQGLSNAGGNLYRSTVISGEPLVGVANAGGRGAVAGGVLEQSNVDLAAEFVSLITAQRGYQANARIITTADQVYAETVQLKN